MERSDIEDIIRKLQICQNMANKRSLGKDERHYGHTAEFYDGQANAYGDAIHYLENLLKTTKG